MLFDQILVLGLLIGVLAIPPLFSAYVDRRPPRAAVVMMLISALLLAVALTQKPDGYDFAQMPDVLTRVIAGLLR